MFESNYFEKHLRSVASKNVFIKLRKVKIVNKGFNSSLKTYFSLFSFLLSHDWFPSQFVFIYNISLMS